MTTLFPPRGTATKTVAALVVLLPAIVIGGTVTSVMTSTAAEAKRTKAERQADRAQTRVERARYRADVAQGRATAAEERVQRRVVKALDKIRALPPKPNP